MFPDGIRKYSITLARPAAGRGASAAAATAATATMMAERLTSRAYVSHSISAMRVSTVLFDLDGTLIDSGGIIVASTCTASSGANDDFCVNRFQGDPYTGVRCTMDIDGDGVIAATTDGLLFSRAAMGLTGTAVTNGITFAASATRADWDSIRDYLNLHCGTRTGR